MSAIVKVEDLTYIYNQGMPDETVALDHVSFEIEEGEFVGVIGSTGCGKSRSSRTSTVSTSLPPARCTLPVRICGRTPKTSAVFVL